MGNPAGSRGSVTGSVGQVQVTER